MTPSDWDVVRGAINFRRMEDEHLWQEAHAALVALERLKAENERLRMWIATDVARARGLAESMTELGTTVRLEGIEENCAEIVALLAPALQPEEAA